MCDVGEQGLYQFPVFHPVRMCNSVVVDLNSGTRARTKNAAVNEEVTQHRPRGLQCEPCGEGRFLRKEECRWCTRCSQNQGNVRVKGGGRS